MNGLLGTSKFQPTTAPGAVIQFPLQTLDTRVIFLLVRNEKKVAEPAPLASFKLVNISDQII